MQNWSTYIIGEIGQNHNGSMALARQLIDVAALPVIDASFGTELAAMNAIKLTKRDLAEELTASEMQRPYQNEHSFGATYGEHRAVLELSDEQHLELYHYAKTKGLDVVETLCAPGALSLLEKFTPDFLKVASRDLTNSPLLSAMAETKIPIILSTGMGGQAELDEALSVIERYHQKITILHCLSEYPAQYHNINLQTITYLKKRYPQYIIGYSDHSVGIAVPVAAVALGARVIEKHITLSRSLKGSDHAGSLAPDGIFRMVRDIRNIERSLGEEKMEISPAVASTAAKLERSLAARHNLSIGHTITERDLHLLSPGTGFKWSQRGLVIGRRVVRTINQDELIVEECLASVAEPVATRLSK